jgi:YfiH family protein
MEALQSVALQSRELSSAGFAHAFALRALDFRPGPQREANAKRLAEIVGFDASALYQVSQVHGANVVVAEGDPALFSRTEADAIVATRANVAVGVRVADCVPIMVGDRKSGRVAAIHAGWRGVVANVIGAALERLGAHREGLVAAIGPCIGPCCFEVGADVAKQIANAAPGANVVAREYEDKALIDLRAAVRAQLAGARVSDIEGCTRCDAARFFSYRRDGADGGRHVAVIVARGSRS